MPSRIGFAAEASYVAEYSIVFARSARHELEVLDPLIIRRILPKIESLANNPRPHSARKLTVFAHEPQPRPLAFL
jgi:hypothetical protein